MVQLPERLWAEIYELLHFDKKGVVQSLAFSILRDHVFADKYRTVINSAKSERIYDEKG